MSGDGKNCQPIESIQTDIKVQCSPDGIHVVLGEEKHPFVGRVFVNGQRENPYCSKTFDTQQAYPTTQQPYTFYIPISHCNMKLENQSTLSTTIMVQKHSTFITEKAYAYQVRCTYPLGTKFVDSKVGINEIEESAVTPLNGNNQQPTCTFSVTNLENIRVNSALVGQVLKLALSVEPNNTYGIRPQNCFAINLETSERHRLTDENGCASDTDLFPQWTQASTSRTQAIFRTFKWPDCRLVRFECDCSPCLGLCPTTNCQRQTYRVKRRLMRSNRQEIIEEEESSTNSTNDNIEDESWMKNLNSKRTAFSSVIYVREKQESEEAQREFEEWLSKGLL